MTGLTIHWKKSSRSNSNGNCVEARLHEGHVEIRDSKDTAGPALSITRDAHVSFVNALKAGDFDRT